jgi:hypothetical protein
LRPAHANDPGLARVLSSRRSASTSKRSGASRMQRVPGWWWITPRRRLPPHRCLTGRLRLRGDLQVAARHDRHGGHGVEPARQPDWAPATAGWHSIDGMDRPDYAAGLRLRADAMRVTRGNPSHAVPMC